jgi:hypothetical protein
MKLKALIVALTFVCVTVTQCSLSERMAAKSNKINTAKQDGRSGKAFAVDACSKCAKGGGGGNGCSRCNKT